MVNACYRKNRSVAKNYAISGVSTAVFRVIHARMAATEGKDSADELVKGLLEQIATLANHHLYPLVDVAHQAELRNVEADQSASQTPLDANEIARRSLEMFRIVFTLVGSLSLAFAPGATTLWLFR